MFLLNPRHNDRHYPEPRSSEIMAKTIAFFEKKGLDKLKEDYNGAVWYADFLDFSVVLVPVALFCLHALLAPRRKIVWL